MFWHKTYQADHFRPWSCSNFKLKQLVLTLKQLNLVDNIFWDLLPLKILSKKSFLFNFLKWGWLGWLKISLFSKIISALPSWMFLGICDEILINSNPFGVSPTALIAPSVLELKEDYTTVSSGGQNANILAPGPQIKKRIFHFLKL